MYYVQKKISFPPKMAMMKISASFPPWDGRPCGHGDLNISVTPSDFRPLPHPFVLYAPLTGESSLSLGLGQLWLNLDPFRLLVLPFGIAFHHQLVLLSYHPIFLLPYHFLKFVSFLGANRTKSASVGPRLLKCGIINTSIQYNTIQYALALVMGLVLFLSSTPFLRYTPVTRQFHATHHRSRCDTLVCRDTPVEKLLYLFWHRRRVILCIYVGLSKTNCLLYYKSD